MSEEKDLDLQESEGSDDLEELDIDGLGDLADFVDLMDLEDLEGSDNADIFGDLGDIGDLGELADFSAAVPEEPAAEDLDIPEYIDLGDEGDTASDAEETVIPTLDVPILTPEEIEAELSSSDEEASLPVEEPAMMEEIPLPEDIPAEVEDVPVPEEVPVMDEVSVPEVVPVMEEIPAMEEIPMEDNIAAAEPADDGMADFAITEDGLLGDLDINFDDFPAEPAEPVADAEPAAEFASVDPEPVAEFASVDPEPVAAEEPAGNSGLDSMLGGILGNLDMGSSMDGGESAADEAADLLGLEDAGAMDEDISLDMDMLDASMLPDGGAEAEKKPGFFKRIFGNVITDEIAEEERAAAEKEAEEALQAEEEAKQAAEEKAKAKEQKKAEKAAQAEAKKKAKAEEKARKAEEKAARKAEEEEEAAKEIEVVGKLNKVGVSIIAIATVLFLVFEISGTNIFSYVKTKKEATNYFKMGKYTEAYQAAIGTDMKNKDKEEYDKIKTVMRVQQAINAYQNYSRVKYYPEALDALLRGLKRYDANIEHGVALEVDKDMLSCRKQILSILETEFHMTESDAYGIISLEKPQYQSKVIDLGIKKATQ